MKRASNESDTIDLSAILGENLTEERDGSRQTRNTNKRPPGGIY